jgi:hypothetical protein
MVVVYFLWLKTSYSCYVALGENLKAKAREKVLGGNYSHTNVLRIHEMFVPTLLISPIGGRLIEVQSTQPSCG